MKEQIFAYYRSVFNNDADVESSIELQVRDNLPTVTVGKYNARQKAVCDFCKERHDNLTDYCELEVMGLDTRVPLIASKVLLQNVIDQMFYERTLALAVMFKSANLIKL